MKLLIIGGGAGGAAAAVRARRLDESAEIVIVERGDCISYASCGLPYYAGDVIKYADQLIIHTAESLGKRFNVDIRLRSAAISIDPKKKSVEIKDLSSGKTYSESYDYLILSPGAKPIIPPIDGADLPCVHQVRTIPDIEKIKTKLDGGTVKRAVIVGAGYIGLEMAENIKARGIETDIVEREDQVVPVFDREMASILHRHIRKQGVGLHLNCQVTGFKASPDGGCVVQSSSGEEYPADIVIICVGVKPEVELAKDADLKMGRRGILTDERMRTSNRSIFAMGDAVETKDPVTGSSRPIALAGPAAKQARVAANNIFGIADRYEGAYGTAIVKVFHIAAAMTGATERALKTAGTQYAKIYSHPADHATYYPGASSLSIKLVFDPKKSELLGAQVIGRSGVDKRIDVLATALKHRLTVKDLAKLELAYAPPFGEAKDPINLAGMAAMNGLQGLVKYAHWDSLTGNEFLLDVRTPRELKRGAVPGSKNIPVDILRERLDELPRDREIAIYCREGYRSYIACRILEQKGFRAVNISGGYLTYRNFKDASLV